MQTFNSPAWVLWLVPLLALAVQIPPHARINTRCHPVWNADRSNLDVVWKGKTYTQPWTFNIEVDEHDETCMADECVQRLWCTDSGVVGRYVIDGQRNGSLAHLRLDFAWLEDLSKRGSLMLDNPIGTGAVAAFSDAHGHGALTVAGDDLLFFTSDPEEANCPLLSVARFDAHRAEAPVSELWRFVLRGASSGSIRPLLPSWTALAYRSQPGEAVVEIRVLNDEGVPRAWMTSYIPYGRQHEDSLAASLSLGPGSPKWLSGSVEFDTLSCQARDGGVRCASAPGRGPYEDLPALTAVHAPGGHVVGAGLGFALYARAGTLYVVERRFDAACPSRLRLAVVARDAAHNLSVTAVSQKLGCYTEQAFPRTTEDETPFEATAVKTAGLTEAGIAFHVALDIARHEYAVLRAACDEGEYLVGETCTRCRISHFCPGLPGLASDMRACPPGSHADGEGMARCAVARGMYFRLPGEVLLCEPGFFCPGGLSEREQCPRDRPRSAPGAWSAAQCML